MVDYTNDAARWTAIAVVIAGLCLAWPVRAWAQEPTPGTRSATTTAGGVPEDPRWLVTAAWEWHLDRIRYAFDNPSAITTTFLVPHVYEQRYWATNMWAVGRAQYEVLGNTFTTEVGITPTRTSRASDIDTFFNPDNDVVTSGTDGNASLHAWRFVHWSHGRVGGVDFRMGYKLRFDYGDFHPDDVVVTHSSPASTSSRFTTDQEFTKSRVQDLAADFSSRLSLARGWRLVWTANASPLVVAQLTTELPQKYPGQKLVSVAHAAAYGLRLQAERTEGQWPLVVGFEWGKTASYSKKNTFDRDTLEMSVGLAWGK